MTDSIVRWFDEKVNVFIEQPLEISKSQRKLEVVEKEPALVEVKVNKPGIEGLWLKNGTALDFTKQTR